MVLIVILEFNHPEKFRAGHVMCPHRCALQVAEHHSWNLRRQMRGQTRPSLSGRGSERQTNGQNYVG